MPLSFPNFNIYSTPLLILALQGLLFAGLLFGKYRRSKNISYGILAVILVITCYHRTTYTIGFMDWYDTYRNTKINYYLVNLGLILIPLIYFYVRSITVSDFKFRRKDLWHFVPGILFFLIKMVILIYDSQQPGFADSQNGYLVQNFQWKYLDPFHLMFSYVQTIVYLVLTLQAYFNYRKNIQNYFSNTYRLELNWIRNFLFIYTFLFVYDLGQSMVNLAITEMSWTQKWWLQFFNALAILYVGVMGYFTNTGSISGLQFDGNRTLLATSDVEAQKSPAQNSLLDDSVLTSIKQYFSEQRPYLDPDLNLLQLAEDLGMNRAALSEAINSGFGQNFNDFVNSYRVAAVEKMLAEGRHKQLSLLGIAHECGFNSKATFNRVFRKFTQQSPSQYLQSLTS